MFNLIRRLLPVVWPFPGSGREQSRPGRVRARYDAARTTDDNRRHWAEADGLSAAAANSPDVRKRLRERSRYEFDNNGYCGGLIEGLAADMIGTGPQLSILDESIAGPIEAAWREWVEAAGLIDDLITFVTAKKKDGEAFAILASGDYGHPVRLAVELVECDQCETPDIWTRNQKVSGIELGPGGRPVAYHFLRSHPGDLSGWGWSGEYERIGAGSVVHWFRRTRPGQYRGVPETTRSLALYSQLRRYTLAVLTAAETAADIAAVIETDGPPAEDSDPWQSLEIERGMMMTMPSGSKVKQISAEQPTTTYKDFKRELLSEIGRPHQAPYNWTAGDSSGHNFSSARLDIMGYRSAVKVERNSFRRVVLDPIFRAWLREAAMIPGYLPEGAASAAWGWRWPGWEAVNPIDDAKADTERLANGTATLAEVLGEYGQDWREVLRQRAAELAMMKALGLPLPGSGGQGGGQGGGGNPNDSGQDDGQGDDGQEWQP